MKKVLIYGFPQNQAVFLTPTVNFLFGNCRIFFAGTTDELKNSPEQFDSICINASLHFWQLDFAISLAKKNVKEHILGLSQVSVSQKNLELLFQHGIRHILINLKHQDELIHCKKAIETNTSYHSKGSIILKNKNYESNSDIYNKLSDKQKSAFHYMMSGKSLKEFRTDFGFKALSTASTHWNLVLKKYQVHSVIQLRNKY
ncbi:hypothetical protein [Treponema sp. C6A8]|uniref:hypothetical protein n=1 Tax=Treponema sp. C6A8 TaxID=1410609 RepID=UPI000482752F|nr:hypothetical protein [Treponema sp. C6A8]